jgi:tRNA dimethylallyltransferase
MSVFDSQPLCYKHLQLAAGCRASSKQHCGFAATGAELFREFLSLSLCCFWSRALQRGKTPIVVGGTGFYLRWFIYGKAATPPSNPATAAKARALVEQAWDAAAAAAAAAKVAEQQAAAKAAEQQAAAAAAEGLQAVQLQEASNCVQQEEQQQQQQEQQRHSRVQQQQQPYVQQQHQRHLEQAKQPSNAEGPQQQDQQAAAAAAAAEGATIHSSSSLKAVARNAASVAAAAAAAAGGLGPAQPTPSAAAAAALTDEQRWHLAVDVVEQLGDAATASRIRAERNNWYRLQRVLQILLQNGGKPLSEMDIDTAKPLDYDFRWAGLLDCLFDQVV